MRLNVSYQKVILMIALLKYAGGGTESQDWQMLRRMYMKWSNNREFKHFIISEHKGDAGKNQQQ